MRTSYEPADPGAGGDIEVVEALPGHGGGIAVQLGDLEQPDGGFRHCVVELSPMVPIDGAAPISARRSV
jgi:hypothetical protein